MRIPIILAFVALLSGCNATQAINPSGQANRCANDPSCNPYNPSSYAQNNVGIGGAAKRRSRDCRTGRPSRLFLRLGCLGPSSFRCEDPC